MASPVASTTVDSMAIFNMLPTFSISSINPVTQSPQSASHSSQVLTDSVSSRPSTPTFLPNSSFFSSFYEPDFSSTTTTPTPSSPTQTTPTLLISIPSSTISDLSDNSTAMSLAWIALIVIGSITLIILALAFYISRRRTLTIEAELGSTPQSSPRPWSSMEVRPGMIRRTTTSRIRDEWQQWIERPPPLRNVLRREDSAVLFGSGTISGSRLSFQPLLSADEVAASGVLDSTDILDPPPAYTPRRI